MNNMVFTVLMACGGVAIAIQLSICYAKIKPLYHLKRMV
jgi:hypothetical protein